MSRSIPVKTAVFITATGLLGGLSVAQFQAFGEVPLTAKSSIEQTLCSIESTADHRNNQIQLDSFSIDAHEVTNRQFARFVEETGYLTTAERELDEKDYPSVDKSFLVAGSAVFQKPISVTSNAISTNSINQWWSFVPGANWQHPQGPDSTIESKDHLPVVHITFDDAAAYAAWAGRALPTENQWQAAATHRAPPYTTQWHETPAGKPIANIWHGLFPIRNTAEDGFEGIAPIGCFSPNAAGISDMIGNVWEWTVDDFQQNPNALPRLDGEIPTNAATKIIKGGSYLCSGNFCTNYHPAARFPQDASLGTDHLGFRTVSLSK